ncbi:YceI family protein [Burkholderia sp. TSV86]|uniref:YceI family protein n=1 Tax=Burkholderia sp. TSV86 TaxID=1385594 RepID=UPI00075E7388|nr:YceI family protein [Burkholderia sp. TSV86]KVE35670.1 hypothetical protein WS68_06730 [Burkholderia sp. TSV86]
MKPVQWAMSIASIAALAATLPGCMPWRVVTHHPTAAQAAVPVGRYALDPHHWSIVFDVDHLKYSRFAMRFDRASAQLDWRTGGLTESSATVSIDASSIDTNVPLLDKLIAGNDALDTARHPHIRFESTRFTRISDTQGTLSGNLTILDITRPVTLTVTFNGYGGNPLTRQDTLGFSASATFSRAQFGVTSWYPAVGDEVRVRIEAEFVKEGEATRS